MLKSLLGFKRDANSIVDLGKQHACFYLQQAKQQREFVEVVFPGDDTIYQSLLLELDKDENTILIDEFFPSTALVVPGQVLRLSIRQKGGRTLKFQSRVLETYHYDNAPMHVIAMPDFIDYDQRRNAFRLPVDSNLVVDLDFTAPDKKIYSGRIGDISATGLSLHLPEPPDCDLTYGDRLDNVSFEFADMVINSGLTIRNLPPKMEPQAALRIGAEFTGLSQSQSKNLELTILQIQRERLRRGDTLRENLIN